MDKAVEELLARAPGAVIAIGIIVLVIYLVREYRKIREETEKSVKDTVNARLGEIMSGIQSEISRLELFSKEQGLKIAEVNLMFEQFTKDVEKKSTEIGHIYKEAQDKLGALKESIPNVNEYSARDLLGLAQTRETPRAKTELCSRILEHEDATAKELELAGDMMRQESRYSLALQLYNAAHQKDPDRIGPHIELLCLTAELESKEREDAIKIAKDLVLANPHRNGFARIANTLIDLNRYAALSVFSDAFIEALQGKNPKLKALALRNTAVAQKELGNIEASMEAYKAAFEISPEDENILKPYLGLLEEQNKENEYMELCMRLIEIDAADVNYYRIYINALVKRRRYSEALEWIEIAKQLGLSEMDRAILQRYEQQVNAANKMLDRSGGDGPRQWSG